MILDIALVAIFGIAVYFAYVFIKGMTPQEQSNLLKDKTSGNEPIDWAIGDKVSAENVILLKPVAFSVG